MSPPARFIPPIPLPDVMTGSNGCLIYPFGNPPNREPNIHAPSKDTRDNRDPEELGLALLEKRASSEFRSAALHVLADLLESE